MTRNRLNVAALDYSVAIRIKMDMVSKLIVKLFAKLSIQISQGMFQNR